MVRKKRTISTRHSARGKICHVHAAANFDFTALRLRAQNLRCFFSMLVCGSLLLPQAVLRRGTLSRCGTRCRVWLSISAREKAAHKPSMATTGCSSNTHPSCATISRRTDTTAYCSVTAPIPSPRAKKETPFRVSLSVKNQVLN